MIGSTRHRLVVFANRAPYTHEHDQNGGIRIVRPASGLVSALEPVLRRRGGLWIAHGNGTADLEYSNQDGELDVPPGESSYRLKRIWLSPSEKKAYYDGFSNEALWPLFHIAHHRPIFRHHDWLIYRRINERFAAALSPDAIEEGTPILIQDFHLALLPQLLRARSEAVWKTAPMALVWHIPWVPADVLCICPWAREILEGILGADVLTFHTTSDVANFLDSCSRLLESHIDRRRSMVTYRGRTTQVSASPIGIDPPVLSMKSKKELRDTIRQRFGISPELLALGVDRLDYTKGIPERLRGIEEFFSTYPDYLGRLTFLQILAPSRIELEAYQKLAILVEELAEAIQTRLQRMAESRISTSDRLKEAPPMLLISSQQQWSELAELYQAADLCVVSPLHDGMNLVAKEYVWTRTPASPGALILSRFAGSSQELSDALLVNPYDSSDLARTFKTALDLSDDERWNRMSRLQTAVRSRTAQDWANEILASLAG